MLRVDCFFEVKYTIYVTSESRTPTIFHDFNYLDLATDAQANVRCGDLQSKCHVVVI